MNEKWASNNCPTKDKDKPNIVCRDDSRFTTREYFGQVSGQYHTRFYFEEFRLVKVTLDYEDRDQPEAIKTFEAIFGVPPEDLGGIHNNKFWILESGSFVVGRGHAETFTKEEMAVWNND